MLSLIESLKFVTGSSFGRSEKSGVCGQINPSFFPPPPTPDKKVELSKANTTSGVTVVALEYKRVTLNIKTLFDKKWASIKPRDDVFSTFSFMKSCFIPKKQEILDWREVMDEIYDEFDETIKKLGQEGWTLRSINNRANRVVEHYFSRPL